MIRESKWCVLPLIRLTNMSVTPPPLFSPILTRIFSSGPTNHIYCRNTQSIKVKCSLFESALYIVIENFFYLIDTYSKTELNPTHLHLNLPSCSFIPQKWIKWFWIKWMRRFCKRFIFIVCGGYSCCHSDPKHVTSVYNNASRRDSTSLLQNILLQNNIIKQC